LRQRHDPTRFYVLAANVPDQPHPPGSLAIGLGPIVMPGYLQHPGLVTRVGTEVRYADFDRWAEPLPTLVGRALGQDLAVLLGARIVSYPWYRATPLDAGVRVDVISFEADAAGSARLQACWSIRGSSGTTVCRDDCSSIVEPVDERGAPAQVAALSRALGELARQVASAIPSCRRTSERSGGAGGSSPARARAGGFSTRRRRACLMRCSSARIPPIAGTRA
jgi:uncharacterized lipoprotein YmbA